MIWRALVGSAAALLVAWLALVILLVAARPKGGVTRGALRLLPDALRLVRRLAADPTTPRRHRVLLWLVVVYLASPIDLVPDFIPVLGYADDAIVVGAVVRSVVRRAGPDAVRRSWPGTPDGLRAMWRLAGLPGEANGGPSAGPAA